ncbi:hypothetical protein [Terrisporobacter vanillatitrophus]|uniref:hypothetical protein n=1 Tax=Terrisporobacter vanillatitrophus TaxID=3058402 RepID=UPI003369B74C
MFKNKIGLILILVILGISTIIFVYANKNNEEKITQSTEMSNEKKSSENLEELSVEELTEIRDKEIDKNLEGLKKLEYTKDEIQERKKNILDPNCNSGLINFINNKYKNLVEKDKLIREINLVKYIDSTDEIMDAEGEYFFVTDQEYQISEYLLKNGRTTEITSYENMKFLIQNIEDLSKYIDYENSELLVTLNPYNSENLSNDQKKSLNEEWKKVYSNKNLDPKLKKEIKRIIKE